MSSLEQWFEENGQQVIEASRFLFEHPETAGEEVKSSRHMAEFMEKQGFTLSYGTAGLETAFTAQWGSGKPVIGFLAEYDALPGLGQAPVDYPCEQEGPGHGCGHNLLGMGAAAAAAAAKDSLESSGIKGTVRLYGCPSEEIMLGKIVMAKEGVFDDLDAAVTWHPFDTNRVSADVWLAMDVKKYRFYGKASHAAKTPHLGRSALDAAELMNVGVNYLREHVTEDVRIHYTYLHGGEKPNIVPDFAETSYFIRAKSREHVDDASFRVDEIARGAAIMTQTREECELVSGCKETKLNWPLMELFQEAMEETKLPEYSEDELKFAGNIRKELGIEDGGPLFEGLQPLDKEPQYISIATDVSDVSHIVPTVMLSAAAGCKGTPLHHWTMTAQAGSSIGYKSMLYVAECMARGAVKLYEKPEYLEAAWRDFRSR